MIITKQKSNEDILKLLGGRKNVFIVGCGSCAEQCKTGGKEDVQRMKEFLEKHGKNVTGWIVPDETCHIPLVKRDLRSVDAGLKSSDAVLVMACGAGVSAVRESVEIAIYPSNDTVSVGNTIRLGQFAGRCSLCGECILGETMGYCPITMCPKGVLNGPCGGMDKGKCEVDKNDDCVWVKIYDAMFVCPEERRKVIKAKDYSKMKRGAKTEA